MTKAPPFVDNPDIDSNPEPVANVVSKRIMCWTNNLIATSVVVIVALVVGQQLVSMWVGNRAGESTAPIFASPAFSDLNFAQLEFGDGPWRMQREKTPETGNKATRELLNRCQRLLQESVVPATPPGETEQQLLQQTAGWKPVDQKTGRWRLFHTAKTNSKNSTAGLPAVIGIRDDVEGEHSSRLVTFGIAMPDRSGNGTTLLAFDRRNHDDNQKKIVPIPDNCQKTLSISAAGFGQLVGFRGGSMAEARDFFDRWATGSGYHAAADWQSTDHSTHRQFVTQDKSSESHRVHVNLNLDGNGNLRGLLSIESAQQANRQN